MTINKKSNLAIFIAEAAGTFILVFAVIGTALFNAGFLASDSGTHLGVGFFGVALAAGLAVMASAYSFGYISGGHFNPAVTIAMAVAGRLEWAKTIWYFLAQIFGAIFAAICLYIIAIGKVDSDTEITDLFTSASTGYESLSPSNFGMVSVIFAELILTAIFVMVILMVTRTSKNANMAGLVIGLTLTMLLLVAIPISNGSLNPARSIATALFAGGDGLSQVWLSILIPIIGAVVGGLKVKFLFENDKSE